MSVSDAEKEELDSASECGKWGKNEERKKKRETGCSVDLRKQEHVKPDNSAVVCYVDLFPLRLSSLKRLDQLIAFPPGHSSEVRVKEVNEDDLAPSCSVCHLAQR